MEGDATKGYLTKIFTVSCSLKGETQHLKEIKDYIKKEYVDKNLVTLTNATYYDKDVYILTEDQWKEYKRLKKNKEEDLIGAGFP